MGCIMAKGTKVETKQEKFVRLAKERMPKVIARIRSIANLAHPTNYESTKEQAAKVIATLEAEIEKVREAFANPVAGAVSDTFDFDD